MTFRAPILAAWLATSAVLPACAQETPRAGAKPPAPAASQPEEPGPSRIVLLEPRGSLLNASKLTLRWATSERGPFRVTVVDDQGTPLFTASTFGHEFRVLVDSKFEGDLSSGRTYRWSVEPEVADQGPAPAPITFRILSPEETQAAETRYQEAARRLGVDNESKELDSRLALAELYLKDGFFAEAERELEWLVERGWDDPRIERMLAEIRRKAGLPPAAAPEGEGT